MKKNKKTVMASMLCLLLTLAVCTSSCAKKSLSTAKLVGYDGASFEKTMEAYIADSMNSEVSYIKSEWKNNWVGGIYAPDPSLLSSVEKAVTYQISVTLDYLGEQESNQMLIYLAYNENNNTLTVRGSLFVEDGEQYPSSPEEARSGIAEIFDEYN